MSAGVTITTPCPEDFSLTATLISGQCFRWTCEQSELPQCVGIADGETVRITQREDSLEITGDRRSDGESFWRHYLDLDADYEAMRREVIAAEPRLERAAQRCAGLRILNQQPWEALCSFIISQNNNIPRIRRIVECICAMCAPESAEGLPPFPEAEQVAQLSDKALREAGCGYRVPYILGAARAVADGSFDLESLRTAPIDEARERLLTLKGVGGKVADCVLLYGLHRLECFPRDVWIKRALGGEFKDTPLLGSRYAGLAQQYIFEYIRTKDE